MNLKNVSDFKAQSFQSKKKQIKKGMEKGLWNLRFLKNHISGDVGNQFQQSYITTIFVEFKIQTTSKHTRTKFLMTYSMSYKFLFSC